MHMRGTDATGHGRDDVIDLVVRGNRTLATLSATVKRLPHASVDGRGAVQRGGTSSSCTRVLLIFFLVGEDRML